MQDYTLTLLPQSRVRLRLGFSRNRDQGPGLFTTDGGTVSAFNETYSYTTNSYRVGADFKLLPKTTISYDQFLSYYKQDNTVTDNRRVRVTNLRTARLSTLGSSGAPMDRWRFCRALRRS